MIETLSHPAQSTEFLSRLHDGEISADEAAAFEAHRRECEECRTSVAEFEAALAAYRSAAVAPHASDLSSRILRKIRATTPSRRPFGVMFGIDVRWAGALAAALLVVIIGAPVFSRRPPDVRPAATESAPAAPAPIPAYVVDSEEERAPEKKADEKVGRADVPGPRLRAAPKSEVAAPPPPSVAQSRDEAAGFVAPRSEKPANLAEAPRRNESTAVGAMETKTAETAPAPTLDAAAPSAGSKEATTVMADRRRQSAAAPQGGEAGAGAEDSVVAVKLLIHPADGEGQPPDLARTPPDERLAALRGRKFLLVVETGGRVRAVEERTADKNKFAKDATRETDDLGGTRARSEAESILREIVFQPGDRSRRLLVTIE